jgi:ribose transport system ATP-binding protein
MTVTENLFLEEISQLRRRPFLSWQALERRARVALEQHGLPLDPRAPVESLRPVERALLSISRALSAVEASSSEHPALLVLDEPTVFLPADEVGSLFDFVRAFAKGQSSVLFVSHDLDEVLEITDSVTVLRDGRVAGQRTTAETKAEDLVRLIVGRNLVPSSRSAPTGPAGAVRLRVEDLRTRTLQGLSFDLHEGEILGVTGLVGSGFEDVASAVFGADRGASGRVNYADSTMAVTDLTPRRAMELGVAFVPGDRATLGSIPSLTLTENLTCLVLGQHYKGLRIDHGALDVLARRAMDDYDIRPRRPDYEYSAFSGGNQQKALIAKWLLSNPTVLLLHEPTQGVDVGAREQIWKVVRDSTATSSVLCASSDYEQLAAICDRVLIVARGRIVAELSGADMTKERISDACVRGTRASPTGAVSDDLYDDPDDHEMRRAL